MVIQASMERILGCVPPDQSWVGATHLLVHRDRSQVRTLWGMPVAGSRSVCDENIVVVAARDPDGTRRAPFRPLLRLLVRWTSSGAAIDGVDVPR